MGLLDKLEQGKSNLTGLNGGTPQTPDFALSKLHDTYSADGIPNLNGKPAPTNLADGDPEKYLDNLPR